QPLGLDKVLDHRARNAAAALAARCGDDVEPLQQRRAAHREQAGIAGAHADAVQRARPRVVAERLRGERIERLRRDHRGASALTMNTGSSACSRTDLPASTPRATLSAVTRGDHPPSAARAISTPSRVAKWATTRP